MESVKKYNEWYKINEEGDGGGAAPAGGSGDSGGGSGVAFVGNNQNGQDIVVASAPNVAGSLWQTDTYNLAPGQKPNKIGSGDRVAKKKEEKDEVKLKGDKGKGKDKTLLKTMTKFSEWIGPSKSK